MLDANSAPLATDEYDEEDFPAVPANGFEPEVYNVGDFVSTFFKDSDGDKLGIAILAAGSSDVGQWEYFPGARTGDWESIPVGPDLGVDLPGYDPNGTHISYRGRLDSASVLRMLQCR